MDPGQPPLGFESNDINPEMLSQGSLEVATQPVQLPNSIDTHGRESWDASVPWEEGSQDRFEDGWDEWAQFLNLEAQQAIAVRGMLPEKGAHGFEQPSQGVGELTSRSSLAERQAPFNPPNQLLIPSDNSFQSIQPAHGSSTEEYRLDSSNAISNTSSCTGSPVITPGSEDDNVPAVSMPKNTKPKAVAASSNRKRGHDEMKGMTLTFPIRENQPPVGRTKKSYSPRRRKEVALARQMGACPRCKFRKVSVSHKREIAIHLLN